MTNELKVGFFVLIGVVILGISLVLLGDISFHRSYYIDVVFDDVGGLANKSIVKLNGVEVGRIKEIWMEDEKVIARVYINEGVKIYKDSKFYIAKTSIIGSSFLQISQGKNYREILKNGDRVYAVSSKPLEEMIFDVADNLNKLIKQISSNGEFASNLNETMRNLRSITANLNEIISSNSSKVDSISAKLDDALTNIRNLTEKLDNILARVEKGEGTVGTLISDSKTASDVKESISNIKDATKFLKDFISKTSKIRLYLNFEHKYEPKARESFVNVGLKIQVNDNKYYYAGASNVLNIKNKPRGISYEIPNTVDAYLGWDYPLWGFYMGTIRGTGGFGFRYTPFYYDNFFSRFNLNFEVNEFSRNRKIKQRFFNDARYDIGLGYNISKIISANVKLTDILEVKRFQFSTRVIFEDKDLARLFGFVGGNSSLLVK
jgi:phospholipid/cholesterol/gamma-HCH transport system substrate-binding protein